MKIATDHGFPRPSFGGSDPNAFDAFKNERDYIAQGGRMKTTVAAMDWAAAEIERLRAAGLAIITANDEFRASLPHGWDGDPVNDACEAARPLFKNEQAAQNDKGETP